jgi:hypothetical protein
MIETLCAAVDGERMMRNLAAIARWTKLSGTPTELESMRHVKELMDEAGYRTELLSHNAWISLPGPARVLVDNQALTAITHSMSLPSPAGGLSGRLVDVGEGNDADLAGKDLAGCILMVDGIASPAFADRAARVGAAAQLHVSPHEHLHEMCISPVWGSPSAETVESLPRTVAVTISQADGQALRARLARGDTPEVVVHAEVDTGWRPTPILVAELDAPNAAPDAPFILFSGHHDTWFEGVMDNGSANMTMVETARLLATQRNAWKRGLRLCFWSGHSQGRYSGSTWYVDNHWDELERRCAVHVNVDSTGGVGATAMGESASSAELAGLAREVIRARTGQEHRGKRMSRNSDQSFWGVGISSLFAALSQQPPSALKMRNALGWWWHTSSDLLDKIDPAFLVRDTQVYVHAIGRLLTDRVLPLDISASVTALLAELEKLRPVSSHGVALDSTIEAAEALRAAAARLRDSGADAARLDAGLIRATRALVPLDYTQGDRFTHDPALPMPAWPVLEPLRKLVGAERGSDAAQFLAVSATRARNRIGHALREARAALEASGG